ncbi:MAG: hypothetical protein LC785_03990 [Acidobacteria bacterium]|nr:hypothetical protein [Acidobacteriota bacterium]MCA1641145.1 hypothetical protein [Acidobacteriota bacterium]
MAEKSVRAEGDTTGRPTVAGIFRRAQQLRSENAQLSRRDLKARLVREFRGGEFPTLDRLTIPEQDARAPEEDWTAGLPLVRRGIQNEDWDDLADGIALCLEQTDNYESQRGFTGAVDEWHDRTVGISEPLTKGIGKWMPDELKRLVDKAAKGDK